MSWLNASVDCGASAMMLLGSVGGGSVDGGSDRGFVSWFVELSLDAPGQEHGDRDPEARILGIAAELDPAGPQLGHRRFEVVAHERQLVHRRTAVTDRVHAELGRWQLEDQPARVGL